MSLRYQYNATNQIFCPVNPDTVIHLDDFVGMREASIFPASDLQGLMYPNSYSDRFASRFFLGIAMLPSKKGEDKPIPVATSGVFKYPLDNPEKIHLGQYLALILHETNPALCNQKLCVGNKYNFVGVASQFSPGFKPVDSVLIDIRSAIMRKR